MARRVKPDYKFVKFKAIDDKGNIFQLCDTYRMRWLHISGPSISATCLNFSGPKTLRALAYAILRTIPARKRK